MQRPSYRGVSLCSLSFTILCNNYDINNHNINDYKKCLPYIRHEYVCWTSVQVNEINIKHKLLKKFGLYV